MKEHSLYFIDTNIFLRVLIKENEKTFGECFGILNKIKKGEIKAFTSSLVLAEINWVLGSFYRFSKFQVAESLKGIINLKGLKIVDKHNLRLAVSIYEKHNVKFVDALIASNFLIFRNKFLAVVVSYDRDFDRIGIKRKEPGEFL